VASYMPGSKGICYLENLYNMALNKKTKLAYKPDILQCRITSQCWPG